MHLRSPDYDLKTFSESVLDLDVREILDAVLQEMHSIKTQCRRLGRGHIPEKGTKARQYFDDLNFLVPLFTGATPTFRDGYVEEAWPMLWKMSGSLVALSSLRGASRHPPLSFTKESLVEMAREHWQEYLPQKFQDLEVSGKLDQELSVAAEMTLQAMHIDREVGYSQHEAWIANREHHLILPAEDNEDDDEPIPDNPGWIALVESNRTPNPDDDD